MTAIRALTCALLLTLLLAPVASADDIRVCVRDGQVVTGPDCYDSDGGADEDPVEGDDIVVCVRDGQVVTGPDCYS